MHEWEGRPFDDIAALCARRDPRRYPFGCVTAGPAAREVLQWFRSIAEMEGFLWRMEPQRWGLRLGELAAFKSRTETVLTGLDVEGAVESLREAHNALSRPLFEIRWWGHLADLRAGRGDWAAAALARFRQGDLAPITDEELERFLGDLRAL